MTSPVSFDDSVRKFLELGWTNRKIARELDASPTRVQGARTRINTGPHPVLPAGTAAPAGEEDLPRRRPVTPAVLLAIALTVAAVIAAGLVWDRFLHPPAPAPQYTLCVQISPAGTVSGVAGGSDGTCPPRWTAVVLAPGR